MRTIRIGSGAGYSGDRIEPAVELAEKGDIDYLVFECLGERTVALAQQARMKNPEGGYDPLLEERMRAVLPLCAAKGIKIVTNMGAANPQAAARKTAEIARSTGPPSLKIAAVSATMCSMPARTATFRSWNSTARSSSSATACCPPMPISAPSRSRRRLRAGADVVITGRASDPALFLAPMIHAFGWAMDDWNLLGRARSPAICWNAPARSPAAILPIPATRTLPDLARLGFPIGEVGEDGTLVITKVAGSGGAVTAQTCKEQLLYEVHDPAALSPARRGRGFLAGDGRGDRARPRALSAAGAAARRTDTLKVSVGYVDSFIGEGQISYAGPGALARGRLALEIVRERLKLTGVADQRIAVRPDRRQLAARPRGLRAGQRTLRGARPRRRPHRKPARGGADRQRGRDALHQRPAGGGGAWKSARDVVAVASVLLPRELARPRVRFVEA